MNSNCKDFCLEHLLTVSEIFLGKSYRYFYRREKKLEARNPSSKIESPEMEEEEGRHHPLFLLGPRGWGWGGVNIPPSSWTFSRLKKIPPLSASDKIFSQNRGRWGDGGPGAGGKMLPEFGWAPPPSRWGASHLKKGLVVNTLRKQCLLSILTLYS